MFKDSNFFSNSLIFSIFLKDFMEERTKKRKKKLNSKEIQLFQKFMNRIYFFSKSLLNSSTVTFFSFRDTLSRIVANTLSSNARRLISVA